MNATRQHRRSRAAPAGSRGRGFTLVEMLAVLAVMGIMFAVAVIGFNAFGRGTRLRTAAESIRQHLTYARQLAMTRRAQYGVQFDDGTDPQRFRVYGLKATGSGPNQRATVGKWIELPLGIKYGDNHEPHPGYMPPTEIQFAPTGRAVANDLQFRIHDVDSGKERAIEVVPVTGQAKVSAP
jgi:prepilin-type N-terminal cleavage/methylation domain-containing protein